MRPAPALRLACLALCAAAAAACGPRATAPPAPGSILSDLEARDAVVRTQGDFVEALRREGYVLRVQPLSTPVAYPTVAVTEYGVEAGPDGRRTGAFLQVYTFPSADAAEEVGRRVRGRTPPLSVRTVFQHGRLVVLSYTPRLRPSALRDDLVRLLREDGA